MLHTTPDTADRSDALTCWSAAALLRSGRQSAMGDEEFAVLLEELLCAVSRELDDDPESVPKAVRCAAVDLAEHVVRRSSIPVPRWSGEPGRHPDHPAAVPYSRSLRLGRMG